MPAPANVEAHLKALHAVYVARAGYPIAWNLARQNQWYEWCRWADWTWGETELARVIHYLRSKINKGERNEGALKFTNLIGMPDKFEEDLALAIEAGKGNAMFKVKPERPSTVKGQEAELPPVEEALDWVKQLRGEARSGD